MKQEPSAQSSQLNFQNRGVAIERTRPWQMSTRQKVTVSGLGIMRKTETGNRLKRDAEESIHLTPLLFDGWNEEDRLLRVVCRFSAGHYLLTQELLARKKKKCQCTPGQEWRQEGQVVTISFISFSESFLLEARQKANRTFKGSQIKVQPKSLLKHFEVDST